MSELRVRPCAIAGLYEISLVVNRDARGSFREVFQAEKLEALGLPALGPVQWNISTNDKRGTLRGIHAEPWDKYIHVLTGSAFAAIVDLRPESPTFKQHEEFTLTPDNAIFVARGLGNSYQTLADDCLYGYLVNQHWSPDGMYSLVSYRDPELAIPWPISPAIVSEKDEAHPPLAAGG
ncbi:MAG TPA: dTDP-4-dehydrorhamnose 3,5-epimerase family protein [Acidimicrobiales bacterium]|nr:dTDP-4-dehydrorhamnose 3,5-epimerase family protein [Acidimicrobiales bacterium]